MGIIKLFRPACASLKFYASQKQIRFSIESTRSTHAELLRQSRASRSRLQFFMPRGAVAVACRIGEVATPETANRKLRSAAFRCRHPGSATCRLRSVPCASILSISGLVTRITRLIDVAYDPPCMRACLAEGHTPQTGSFARPS